MPWVQQERRQCVRQAYGLYSSIPLHPPLGKRSYELVSIKKKKCGCFSCLSPPPRMISLQRYEKNTYLGYINSGVPFISLQVSLKKHIIAIAQAFGWLSLSAKRAFWAQTWHLTKDRERDQTGSSVWEEGLQIGQWSLDKNKDDPVKYITITRYYPVLLSPLIALTEKCMMNFADLLAVNRKKKQKKNSQAPSHPLLLLFSNYFCVTYVKPEV